MIDVSAFNWTYWVKSFIYSLYIFIFLFFIIQSYLLIRGGEFIGFVKMMLLLMVAIFATIIVSYIRLPYIKSEFYDNKQVLSGELCGFTGSREWYVICVSDHYFRSYETSRSMLNDAIFNFGWIDKPEGCVEIHYLHKGEDAAGRGTPPYTRVIIGRLREIPCGKLKLIRHPS